MGGLRLSYSNILILFIIICMQNNYTSTASYYLYIKQKILYNLGFCRFGNFWLGKTDRIIYKINYGHH